MTRKDYVALARALAKAFQINGGRLPASAVARYRGHGVEAAALHIADVLAADHPRFDRGWFLTAARGES